MTTNDPARFDRLAATMAAMLRHRHARANVAELARLLLHAHHGGAWRAAAALIARWAVDRREVLRMRAHQRLARWGLHSEAGCGVCEPLGSEDVD